MNVTLARRLVSLARRAYLKADPAADAVWQPRQVDAFATPAFTGFAASDEHAAYLVFRGTKLHLDSGDTVPAHHAGLARQPRLRPGRGARAPWSIAAMPASSTASTSSLLEMARDHAIGGKPIYVTGHSAGGALATLAARRLHDAGADGARRRRVLRPARRRPALRRDLSRAAPAHRAPARPDPASAAAARRSPALLGRGVLDPLIEAVEWLSPLLSRRPGRPDRVCPCRRAALRRWGEHALSRPARPLSAPVRSAPAARAAGGSAGPGRAARRRRLPRRPPARAGRRPCRRG